TTQEAERRAQIEAERDERSCFKTVAEAYLNDRLKGGGAKLLSRGELLRKLNVELVGWHDRPISEITKADIKKLVRDKAQSSGSSANRLLSFIKRVYAWAAEQDLIEADPSRAIKAPAEEVRRTRFLDDD